MGVVGNKPVRAAGDAVKADPAGTGREGAQCGECVDSAVERHVRYVPGVPEVAALGVAEREGEEAVGGQNGGI